MTAEVRGAAATLSVERVDVDVLVAFPGNPRRGNVAVIADSLRVHGQYRPVVVNRRTMQVLAGNHTVAAARQLGWERVAATFVDVDEEQARRIVLVDNRANDMAGYDDEALVEALQGLPELTGTGYVAGDSTQKPVELVRRPVDWHTRAGEVIYEPFAGSGTAVIAAHSTGRRCYALELEPGFADVVCRRYQGHTGIVPVLEATGQPHDFTVG